ncbi:MAG TPA: hypothetical protein VM865_10105 [Acidobacteriaceae bacterium]|jgi:hypothetical protein|nr:hypothetical protein [Acidobacteriaceae bacterium]
MYIRSFTLAAFVGLYSLSALSQPPQKAAAPEASRPATVAYAPAVDLPPNGMVFAHQNGTSASAVVPLHATEIKSNSHAAGNFARALVYAGPHAGVELSGTRAPITLPATTVLYVRLSSEHPDLDRERATLVRLQEKQDSRQVLEYSRNIFGGSLKRKADEIAVEKTEVEGQLVLRITPVKPLEPGEYGLTFLPKDPAQYSDVVFDFTVSAD